MIGLNGKYMHVLRHSLFSVYCVSSIINRWIFLHSEASGELNLNRRLIPIFRTDRQLTTGVFRNKTKTEIASMSTLKETNLPTHNQSFRTFSIIMAAALEILGYSYRAIKQRHEWFTNLGKTEQGHSVFCVGSKAEGIATLTESDCDLMIVLNSCFCNDDIGEILLKNPAYPQLLLSEMDNLNPGYSKVKVPFPEDLRNLPDTDIVPLLPCTFKQGSGVYLSSALFKDSMPRYEGRGVNVSENNGPAYCFQLCDIFTNDIVIAIPYKCGKLSKEWLVRPRFHEWPSQDDLRHLAKLDWHLVPVGPQKDSFQEWRICFTLGEQYLVQTFNITQLHLLILLKLVMTKTLKPLCSAFSSYTAKNLVFWMVEILAPENFKVENLSSLLMISLQMIRIAVENEQLQNYMIPSRNLFKGKFSREEKDTIIKLLDSFINYGPGFLTKRSEFSDLKAVMQNVNTNTDLAQQLHKRDEFDKKALSIFTMLIPQIVDDEMLVKITDGRCNMIDILKAEKSTIDGIRNLVEEQGVFFTNEQVEDLLKFIYTMQTRIRR